jgi:hypothetical protein
MKKNNGKVSQKKARRQSKNLKRLSKKQGVGHYRDKFKQAFDLNSEQIELTPEQRANAEKALAGSLELSPEELSVVEPWALKNE